MGKYIVELKKNETLYKATTRKSDGTAYVCSAIGTPYTEPDLEKVRKEAYEDGYKTAKVQCNIQAEKDLREVGERHYQKGLSDARDEKATCQYCRHTDKGSSEEPCKTCCMNYHNKFEPKEQITKGDIVRIKSTPEVEILVTYADEEYVSGIALTEVDDNCEIGDQYTNIRICNVEKTGKYYDIVSVLQKMKEASDG